MEGNIEIIPSLPKEKKHKFIDIVFINFQHYQQHKNFNILRDVNQEIISDLKKNLRFCKKIIMILPTNTILSNLSDFLFELKNQNICLNSINLEKIIIRQNLETLIFSFDVQFTNKKITKKYNSANGTNKNKLKISPNYSQNSNLEENNINFLTLNNGKIMSLSSSDKSHSYEKIDEKSEKYNEIDVVSLNESKSEGMITISLHSDTISLID